MSTDLELNFYGEQGLMTDPRQHAGLYSSLPRQLPALVEALQGLTVHIFWAERMGLQLDDSRKAEVNLRATWQKLDRLLELDPAPLDQSRPLEKRLVCNCRDITVLFVSMLRSQGVPARSRCGFGTYFLPGHYEDHWVAEVWNPAETRWQMVDAQLTELMCQVCQVDFDTLDMPPGKFITAGEAWQMCRRDGIDPELFGIFQWHGWDFISGNVLRDLLALNNIEILPWDYWDFGQPDIAEAPPEAWLEIDRIAGLLVNADSDLEAVQHFYRKHPLYRPPFLAEYE